MQVRNKKALSALRKRDEKMLVMFHHTKACPDCTYARPFFADVARDILGRKYIPDIDVVAAVDCTCVHITYEHTLVAPLRYEAPRRRALMCARALPARMTASSRSRA